jgi:hypothetical protein
MTGNRSGRSPTGGKVTGYSLVLNYLPMLYVVAGVAAVWTRDGVTARWLLAVSWIYLLPPIVSRVTIFVFGYPTGRGVRQDARAYKVWWFLAQWQVVFNRLPASSPDCMLPGSTSGERASVCSRTGAPARGYSIGTWRASNAEP